MQSIYNYRLTKLSFQHRINRCKVSPMPFSSHWRRREYLDFPNILYLFIFVVFHLLTMCSFLMREISLGSAWSKVFISNSSLS